MKLRHQPLRQVKKGSPPEKKEEAPTPEHQDVPREQISQVPCPGENVSVSPGAIPSQPAPGYDTSLYLQHPYLYAHPNLPIMVQQGYSPYQSSSSSQPIISPVGSAQVVAPYPYPASYPYPYYPLPQQEKEKEKEKQEEKTPEHIYLNAGLVLVALSSLALFLYSLIYLFLFSQVHWDPSSFSGIWGLGASYTLFAVGFGVASASMGIIASIFLYTRSRYRACLIIVLIITIAGIIQVNPVSIPLSAAAFVLVSMGERLFAAAKEQAQESPKKDETIAHPTPTSRASPPKPKKSS